MRCFLGLVLLLSVAAATYLNEISHFHMCNNGQQSFWLKNKCKRSFLQINEQSLPIGCKLGVSHTCIFSIERQRGLVLL